MSTKQDTPGRGKATGGVDVVFAGDFGLHIITAARVQFLSRHGICATRAATFAPLIWGIVNG